MYFLFDIGGTRIRFSGSSDGVNVGDVEVVETPVTYTEALQVIQKYHSLFSRSGPIDKISGGLAAVFDGDRRSILDAYNLPDWRGRNFAEDLEDLFKCSVFLENDAALEGLGESVEGAGKGAKVVGFITVGTGLGGAKIVNKIIDAKSTGFEPGHQIVDHNSSLDLGDMVSGAGIEKQYGVSPEKIKDQTIWDTNLRILAVGVHNAIVHWSPDIVVVGGGLITEGKYKIEKLNEAVRSVSKGYPLIPPIIQGTLGESAGLVGALRLAKFQAG